MSLPEDNKINIIDTFQKFDNLGESENKKFKYQEDLQYQLLQELDNDFLEYDLHQIPFYKVEKKFYFGGVKKPLLIPISMPHRVIVEANPPRQGYHSSWNSINKYYLQKCLKDQEYTDIMKDCRLMGCKAHSMNRSENGFVSGGYWATVFNIIVIVAFILFSVVTEVIPFAFKKDGTTNEPNSDGNSPPDYQSLNTIVIITFCIAITVVFLSSVYNWLLGVPEKIHVQYEDHLRALLNKHFEKLNETYKGMMKFSISLNPNKALWIEIIIEDRDARVPFSEIEIQKYVDDLQKESDQENDGLAKVKVNLIQFKMIQNQDIAQFEGYNIYRSASEKKIDQLNKVKLEQRRETNRDIQISRKNSLYEKRAHKVGKDEDQWQDA